MALFSRRVLQRVLDENSKFLTAEQNAKVANSLNQTGDYYLALEWEQVILNAAAKCGNVEHERLLGSSRPDLLFRSSDCEFIADITTASDHGFDALNPFDYFRDEVMREIQKRGYSIGGFHLAVSGDVGKIYKGSRERVQLKLPHPSTWKQLVFNSDFGRFLKTVKERPTIRHQFDVTNAETEVHLTYDPSRKDSFGSNHLVYTIATSRQRNPVYSALKSKGDQLKASQYAGMRGVVLCDAGCQILSAEPQHSSFSLREIVQYFLKQFSSIWFVLVFAAKHNGISAILRPTLYTNDSKREQDFSQFEKVANKIATSIPAFEFSPINARNRIEVNDLKGRYYGVLTSGATVKMSARELHEILAGVRTLADFERNYNLDARSNPFKQMFDAGRMISKVTIERVPEKDDDVATIEFSEPDAAIANFRPRNTP